MVSRSWAEMICVLGVSDGCIFLFLLYIPCLLLVFRSSRGLKIINTIKSRPCLLLSHWRKRKPLEVEIRKSIKSSFREIYFLLRVGAWNFIRWGRRYIVSTRRWEVFQVTSSVSTINSRLQNVLSSPKWDGNRHMPIPLLSVPSLNHPLYSRHHTPLPSATLPCSAPHWHLSSSHPSLSRLDLFFKKIPLILYY